MCDLNTSGRGPRHSEGNERGTRRWPRKTQTKSQLPKHTAPTQGQRTALRMWPPAALGCEARGHHGGLPHQQPLRHRWVDWTVWCTMVRSDKQRPLTQPAEPPNLGKIGPLCQMSINMPTSWNPRGPKIRSRLGPRPLPKTSHNLGPKSWPKLAESFPIQNLAQIWWSMGSWGRTWGTRPDCELCGVSAESTDGHTVRERSLSP